MSGVYPAHALLEIRMSRLLRTSFFVNALVVLLFGAGMARADEDAQIGPALAMVKEKYDIDMKKLFSAKCSWCHQGMGMKQADGPMLAGTKKTKEQVKLQISRGKSPMPGFKNQLSEKELDALVDYIKALPSN